jgi:hypothetical protein
MYLNGKYKDGKNYYLDQWPTSKIKINHCFDSTADQYLHTRNTRFAGFLGALRA